MIGCRGWHLKMDRKMPETQSLEQIADLLADEFDADIVHFNGPIQRPIDQHFIDDCTARRRRKNVLLMLVTPGGNPDSAYRIARCLQTHYERFFLYVSGFCKSAGTLVALGAHELIISDHGELGPLDVQLFKKDEIWETRSGLTVMYTLSALKEKAFEVFEELFLHTKGKFGGTITLRTASQIATEMTTGLFKPIYKQIDPLYVGEASMAMLIAGRYGMRLLSEGKNIEVSKLNRMLTAYPSHGYVIDRKEASELFCTVLEPTSTGRCLEQMLGNKARHPDESGSDGQKPYQFLSGRQFITASNSGRKEQENIKHAGIRDVEGTGSEDAVQDAGGKHTGDIGKRGTITELDTARDRHTST